jgi:hypothetical protein
MSETASGKLWVSKCDSVSMKLGDMKLYLGFRIGA